MRRMSLLFAAVSISLLAFSQSTETDEALLARTRSLYDAPFARQLVSFDCALQFDWKQHFLDTLGVVPPDAVPTIQRLQVIQHRVFVDRSGAVVSEIPKATDLSGVPHGEDLEKVLQDFASAGINAWLPFAINEILPIKPTKFTVKREDAGYKVVMAGSNVSATLTLLPDMRIANVKSELPESLHFITDFVSGPNGYLLQSVKVGPGTGDQNKSNARFDYTFQNVQGFQLPATAAVTQYASGEKWFYTLTDCKTMTGIKVNVRAPNP